MIKKIIEILETEKIKYLIVGGMTTLVNLVTFHLLVDVLKWDVTISNILSVILAILFAFVANKFIVFSVKNTDVKSLLTQFSKFIAGRLVTMVIEVGGVYLLHNILVIPAMLAKVATQVIVVILNYFISKYFVFIKKNEHDE